jgi:hypothetical protein
MMHFADKGKSAVTVQHVPQAASASLAEKTRLRLRSPLRSTAAAAGLRDIAANTAFFFDS